MKLFIRSLFIFLLFIFSSLLVFTVSAHAQDNLNITEFLIPTKNSYPHGITTGPDGNLWFTERYGNKIGRITPSGVITEFVVPTSNSYPTGITSGPDGNLWFTENGVSNKIGRITPSGVITEFVVPTSSSGPTGITSGPDGNLWFTETLGNKIGRISTGGFIAEFSIPTAKSYPRNITTGPDGNIWFTEEEANKIGRITPDGTITEFSLGTISVGPYDITTGPDGNLWFTEYSLNRIGRITPNGIITQFIIAPDAVYTHGITTGPDGNLWFTEQSIGESIWKIGKITTSGTISTYPVVNDYIIDITTGPDGNLWFTEQFGGKIGRVNLPSITPTPMPAKTPLILIPGIGGSEFKSNQTFTSTIKDCGILPAFTYNTNDIVWVNTVIAGLSLCDDYFDALKLNPDGQTPEYPQIVLNETFFGGAYGGLIKFFIDNGYELNKTLFLFPYDWRKDISTTKVGLDDKINQIKNQTGSTKVDIIAHSMGGLIARNYISDAGRALNVRKLFALGAPHLGSVDFLKKLRFGGCLMYEFGPFCLSIAPSEVKDVIQNMISGYELAPSQEYFNFYNGQDKGHLFPYQYNGQSLNYDQIKSFLTNLGYNTPLFGPSELFHSLDNSLTNTNGVDVTNIAGSGLPTLGQIIEKSVKDFFGNTVQKKDGFAINGDKTVPLFSASLIDPSRNKSLLGNAKVFYTKQEHGNLAASGPALNLVKNILNNDSQLPDGVSILPYHFSGTGVSVHSPVNIHVYDSLGNHTGPTSNGDFEANIPGSSYDTLDDAKFVFLPDNGVYDIKLEATDQGSFDFKIREYEDDINTTAVLYNNVPLVVATKAQTILDTSSVQPPTLQVDQDGNGIIDKNVDPTLVLTGDAVYDETPPEANIYFDTQTQGVAVTGLDNLGETSITQTDLSKNKEQIVVADKAGNTLTLIDTNRLHGPNAVFSISSLAYNTLPVALDTNKFSIRYQTDKNGSVKSFDQTFEIKGIVKIQLSYDPKTNKTLVAVDRQKIIVDGMKILQISTEKGTLRYTY